MAFSFDLGRPFRPYEQLMGVMPAASRETIPRAYHVRIVSDGETMGFDHFLGSDVW